MNWSRLFTSLTVGLASCGLLLPVPLLADGLLPSESTGRVPAASRVPSISNVELDVDGSLRGIAINVQGVPVGRTEVLVQAPRQAAARTSTDALGCFAVKGLNGGMYQVTAGRQVVLIRAWAAGTAPPKTRRSALIVVGDDVVRGQQPLGEFLTSDAVLISALVAAAIAIPVAVHQANKRRSPASP